MQPAKVTSLFEHSSISYSNSRQFHIPLQSKFSTQCVLVLHLLVYSVLSFSPDYPVAAYIFFLVFPSLTFLLSFRQQRVLKYSSYARCDQSIYPFFYVFHVIHFFSGDRGSTVVKVLRHKSEGRWLDSRWCHWNFALT